MFVARLILTCVLAQSPLPEAPVPGFGGISPMPPASMMPAAALETPVGFPSAPSVAEGANLGRMLDTGTREFFESDRAFPGFVGPLTDIIQAKDPRSLTEARLNVFSNWGRAGTPVLGTGTYQVYALQLRLALTERLQLFADKDGIVRFSPQGGQSATGLANIAAGAKYVFVRDVENQFLFSGVIQYEAPTGYANIYQNQGSGLLAVYGIAAKEFGENWHIVTQFGQNIAMQNQQNGYFYTHAHIDRRFGRLTPLFEVNWYYYNQSTKFLPPIGLEGGGLVNLGTSGMTGRSIVTGTIGTKFDLTDNLELGLGYQFAMQRARSLYGDSLIAQVILRY
jgi:hypothetical protein